MLGLFSVIEGGVVVLASKGVWKQVKLYEREGGELYAAQGSGFIALRKDNRTTVPDVRWDTIVTPEGMTAGTKGNKVVRA